MLEWHDENHGTVCGVPFKYVTENYDEARTTQDEIVVLKPKGFFERYSKFDPPSNVLEVGIFEGGSLLIFAAMWPNARFLGVDFRAQNDDLLKLVEKFGWSDRITIEYGVDQADREKIYDLMDRFMPMPDLVIDDASHLYDLSRKTFEAVFPRLSPGGTYVLEDWAWAHWKSWKAFEHYKGERALSNLVWELVMCSATSPEIVKDVSANSEFAVFRKARSAPCSNSPTKLSTLYTSRGKDWEPLNDALAERDAALVERDAAVAERDSVLAEHKLAILERDAAVVERNAAVEERDAAVKDFIRVSRDSRARKSRLAYWIDYLDFRTHLFLSRIAFAPQSFRERFSRAAQSRKRACYEKN